MLKNWIAPVLGKQADPELTEEQEVGSVRPILEGELVKTP